MTYINKDVTHIDVVLFKWYGRTDEYGLSLESYYYIIEAKEKNNSGFIINI